MSGSSDRAYSHIKAAILSGRFHSGARLPEDVFANELGLSRTPIRDALRRLQVEQLITVTPYSGARVASWSQSDLDEVAQMRAMLEGFAAELAAEKRSPETLSLLTACCTSMEDEMERENPDIDLLSQGNMRFHRLIAEASGNARLLASLDPLWNFPVVIRKFALFGRERVLRSLAHHREILAAIERSDRPWAGTIMRAHILASRSYDAQLTQEGRPEPAEAAMAEP